MEPIGSCINHLFDNQLFQGLLEEEREEATEIPIL